jgi:SPP1 family predicted phage head-tail adaptor
MIIGKLRHRLIFKVNTPTRNKHGGYVDNWSTVSTVWGKVDPLRGNELLLAEQLDTEISVRITVRYSSLVSGITNKHRIVYGSETYEINSIINPELRNEELQFMCSRLA